MAMAASSTSSVGGGSEGDLKLMKEIDPACKSFRKVLQQNSKENTACIRQQRHLDVQKRNIHAKISREEKELRTQLQRLQDEKRLLDLYDDFDHADTTSILNDNYEDDGPKVVNPYPVTFPGRKISAPSRAGWSQEHLGADDGIRSASRAISFSDVGDLDSIASSSVSTLLPPLTSSRMRSRSHVTIIDSMVLGGEDSGQGSWVGDPEAISSIRRPRKSVAQQRKQHHLWTRSSSLKECSRSSSSVRSGICVSRSSSMRERAAAYSPGALSFDDSPRNLSRSSSGALSQTGSMKESGLLKSIECLPSEISALDISPSRQRSLRLKNFVRASDGCSSSVESASPVSEETFQLSNRDGAEILTISIDPSACANSLPPIACLGRDSPGTPPSPLSLKPPSGGGTPRMRTSPRGSLKRRLSPKKKAFEYDANNTSVANE